MKKVEPSGMRVNSMIKRKLYQSKPFLILILILHILSLYGKVHEGYVSFFSVIEVIGIFFWIYAIYTCWFLGDWRWLYDVYADMGILKKRDHDESG